jgi:type I restriction enzyme R subunit
VDFIIITSGRSFRYGQVEVKKIARQLLGKLKQEKLVLDWQMREIAKAGVRETIRQEFDLLPEVYDRKLWNEKVERTYQFVFEHYGSTAGTNISGL